MERKFWKPSVTTQFKVCPVPFHFDTYRGCTYGCLFCFARDFIQFSRRNSENKSQSYLVGNDPVKLERWIERTLQKDYDYNRAEEVAFKERIPVKIGATADPFPFVEEKEHITYDCLKIFNKYDYPVQISTKNPEIFLNYSDDFVGSNIALNFSISFCDDEISRKIEVGAISPTRRFNAIKKLTDKGFKVLVRLQPFIYPYAYENADKFVKMIADSGAFGFQSEGLKLRVVMKKKEKEIYSKIGDVFGLDIFDYFKKNGVIEGGDRVYNPEIKDKVLTLFTNLAEKYNIKFLNADNFIDCKYGHGCECCGTEFLRNYKIWGGCSRSKIYDTKGKQFADEHFGKCIINFVRNKSVLGKTINEVCFSPQDDLPLN